MNNPNYEKLIKKLNELFMLDQAELDFGIYRVMNFRRKEIKSFIENDLLNQVKTELDKSGGVDRKALQKQLDLSIKQAVDLGVDAESSPKVKELRQQLAQSGNAEAMENEVFSHLFAFFNRYYESGDFIALRRYKEGVYAIPYEGEEVKLHWANADQYYIKSSEYFKNYRFTLSDGKTVDFTLRDASTEQNNNKSIGNTERRFKLVEEGPLSCFVPRNDNEVASLRIFFNYEAVEKSVKQDDLTKLALERLEKDVPPAFYELLAKRPTEKNKNRTLLEKHLRDYTARNSFDYFIHKDLGKFLNRELDFFIKNELLVIDDIDTQADAVQHMTAQFAKIVAIKRIAQKIIAFLAQLEDFQRSLWLKKKFVTDVHYCLTLDRVPTAFYADIVANAQQAEEWISLFKIDKIGVYTEGSLFQKEKFTLPLSTKFLAENQGLVLDTRHFSADFKARLLAELPDLDQNTDGLLIQSDNFQALNFLQERYKEQVKCVYIDPPYNTGGDDFVYKDNFKHSSWMTFLQNRMYSSYNLINEKGSFFCSIDDNEMPILMPLISSVFGEENFVANIIWHKRYAASNDSKGIPAMHDYILTYSKSELYERNLLPRTEKQDGLYKYDDKDGRGRWRSDNLSVKTVSESYLYEITNPQTLKTYLPPNGRCWMTNKETILKWIDEKRIFFGQDGKGAPQLKRYLSEVQAGILPLSLWSYDEVGHTDGARKELKGLFEIPPFDNPKPSQLIEKIATISISSSETILDYFAGSGTTGHAVINLNREDNGKRKYILVEQGEYFDTVLLPRLKKVIYAKDWKNGGPLSTETGVPHCLKYLRLESYEDTLNNLSLARTDAQELALGENATFRETYYLNYLFAAESRNALWNIETFANPFDVRLRLLRQNEEREAVIDVVETFNYLLGLIVEKTWTADGFRIVEGTTLDNERLLIVWRNCLDKSADDLNRFFERMNFNARDREFSKIYVNGVHTLTNSLDDTNAPKVLQIEGEFQKRMFL